MWEKNSLPPCPLCPSASVVDSMIRVRQVVALSEPRFIKTRQTSSSQSLTFSFGQLNPQSIIFPSSLGLPIAR